MTKDGDLCVHTCSADTCDGSHVLIEIGFHGEVPIARHIVDAAGAREVAAMLCSAAEYIEAKGLAPRLQ